MNLDRRSLLRAAPFVLAAPAIVRVSNLMLMPRAPVAPMIVYPIIMDEMNFQVDMDKMAEIYGMSRRFLESDKELAERIVHTGIMRDVKASLGWR